MVTRDRDRDAEGEENIHSGGECEIGQIRNYSRVQGVQTFPIPR